MRSCLPSFHVLTETSKRPVLYYMSSDDEVDDEFVRVAAEAEAKAKADEAEAAEPEPKPESEPKPEPEPDSGGATAAETATLEEEARSDAEAATEAQRVEAEDKADSNENLCEDGSSGAALCCCAAARRDIADDDTNVRAHRLRSRCHSTAAPNSPPRAASRSSTSPTSTAPSRWRSMRHARGGMWPRLR